MATARYGIIGHGIGYTRSPDIHNAAFAHLGIDATYEVFDLPPNRVGAFVASAPQHGIAGLNVTQPYKTVIRAHCDELSDVARRIGAVNTLVLRTDTWHGENTDVQGFLAPLVAVRGELAGESVVVLGAGGAARAVVFALLTDCAPSDVTVVARHGESATDLARTARDWSDTDTPCHGLPFAEAHTAVATARLIVNATPVGTRPDIAASPIPADCRFDDRAIIYDLVYDPPETAFLRMGRRRGLRTIGGWEMLIAQAAASFRLWTGQDMPPDTVRKLRNG